VPAAPPPPAPAAAQPDLNKTLLAEQSSTAPPIKYNCPKCKKPFESPASEAGTKKNCPDCGQRFQIPAAPSGTPELNKTLLATTESQAPAAAPAAYPAAVAPVPAAAPAPAGQFQIGSMTITWRHLAVTAALLFLLLIVIPAVIRGGKTTDTDALAKRQLEIDKHNAELERWKTEVKQREMFEEQIRRQLDDITAKLRAQDDQMRDNHRLALRAVNDEKTRAQLEEKFAEERRRFEEEKRQREREQQKILAEAKAEADAARKRAEEAQNKRDIIINQPPPVYYYPPYHPRYYWWWW
jgi:DNA-directed RNA polymerase subunit RPC12/RpoP